MNQLIEWLSRLLSSWKFWIVIPPWEVGIRVRLGKNAVELRPGLHLRIPLVDEITLVNTRLRIETTPSVTVSGGKAGHARVIAATLGFRVTDPLRSVLMWNHPGAAVLSLASAHLATLVPPEECLRLLKEATTGVGVEVEFVYYTENVEVRTYRIINGTGGIWSGPAVGATPSTGY